jgi:Tfp pilus assembly protein PilX
MVRPRRRTTNRRATAMLIVVVLLVVGAVLVSSAAVGGAREQHLTVERLSTLRAFYAAEAGMNLAVREILVNLDEDGDGTIGTVSDDGDSSNDPDIGYASVSVTLTTGASTNLLTSHGVSAEARRRVEVEYE